MGLDVMFLHLSYVFICSPIQYHCLSSSLVHFPLHIHVPTTHFHFNLLFPTDFFKFYNTGLYQISRIKNWILIFFFQSTCYLRKNVYCFEVIIKSFLLFSPPSKLVVLKPGPLITVPQVAVTSSHKII